MPWCICMSCLSLSLSPHCTLNHANLATHYTTHTMLCTHTLPRYTTHTHNALHTHTMLCTHTLSPDTHTHTHTQCIAHTHNALHTHTLSRYTHTHIHNAPHTCTYTGRCNEVRASDSLQQQRSLHGANQEQSQHTRGVYVCV
jgi:hypothetical protein